ncbi:hypothetical protein [uncultured Streptomyces sp.]|uniref:hypothetical protein n=1 Tax=uncultured Streptomyces sp. TaxID=174707 RepID=UPI00261BE42F|nr:hypothetical protein [uncultured Streptomyces sp.]
MSAERSAPWGTGALLVGLDGLSSGRLRSLADILVAEVPRSHGPAVVLTLRTLADHPGCLLVAVRCEDGGCLVALRERDGRTLVHHGPGRVARLGGLVLLAEALYRCHVSTTPYGRTAARPRPCAPDERCPPHAA